jgi:hypothetical protein
VESNLIFISQEERIDTQEHSIQELKTMNDALEDITAKQNIIQNICSQE